MVWYGFMDSGTSCGEVVKIIRDTFRLFYDIVKEVLTPGPEPLAHRMARQGPRDKETILADMKETLEFLKELGVEVTTDPKVEEMKSPYREEPEGICVSVELPYSKDSDYSFDLSFYDDGQRNIGASLIDKNDGKRLKNYFWDSIHEIWDYDTLEELANDFHRTLKILVEYETRVIQQDETGWWSFDCESLINGEWTKVPGGCSGSKRGSGFKFPKIDGIVKLYYSKPLVSKQKKDRASS